MADSTTATEQAATAAERLADDAGACADVTGSAGDQGMTLLIERARALGQVLQVPAGQAVVRRGEARSSLYLIESGAMDVVVTTPDGLRVLVARLGPGSHFGEMSLLTGAPVSADVVAAEPSTLCALTAAQYGQMIAADRELVQCMTAELASRLRRTTEHLAAQQQRQADLGRLVSSRAPRILLDGLPSYTKTLQAAIVAATESASPLALVGEAGVGKRTLARHIATAGPRRDRPVLVVDCADLAPDEAHRQLFGDAEPAAVTRFGDHLGYLQAADGGTLILAGAEQLPVAAQDDLACFVAAHADEQDSDHVSVRLIITTAGPLKAPPQGGEFTAGLLAALATGAAIELRPLRERRRDIIPLAEYLLANIARRSGEPPKQLDAAARRELAGYDFSNGNARELEEALRLAAGLAEGEAIGAQHLFFGPGTNASTLQLDLLRWPLVAWAALQRTALRGLRGLVACVFAAIAVACLLAPDTALGRAANLLAWGVWWPVLVISMLFFGRVWCAVCPLSTGAAAAQAATRGGRIDPGHLARFGPPLAILGFALITWVEQYTDMYHHPFATGVLLTVLALTAATVAQVYRRHTWCRYMCPLGAMGATLTVCSSMRVQVRKEVCMASCTGHECYKGSPTAPGCPMFSHALFLSSGQHCKLCMECLRSCPSRSPRLVLQLPLRDIWRSSTLNGEMAPLAAVVGLSVLLMAAGQNARYAALSHELWSAGIYALVVGAAWVSWRVLSRREQTDGGKNVAWSARVMFAYAPLVASLLLGFHLGAWPWLHGATVGVVTPQGAIVSVTALWLLRVAAGGAGLAMSLWSLFMVCRVRFEKGPQTLFAFAPLAAVALLYTEVVLLLLR